VNMSDTSQSIDQTFLEMRWRCLSLAADLDRVSRLGSIQPANEPRLRKLREAIGVLLEEGVNRAERVQMIYSEPR
jgi:hypothetical protein